MKNIAKAFGFASLGIVGLISLSVLRTEPTMVASTLIRDPEIVAAVRNKSILRVYDRKDTNAPVIDFLAKDLEFCYEKHARYYPAGQNYPLNNTYVEKQHYASGKDKIVVHVNPRDKQTINRLHYLRQ